MGGDLAQPFNEMDSENLLLAITNFTSDAAAEFWIGKNLQTMHIKLSRGG